ncbi:MAG: hypothetical protein ABI222_11825 [Opitutaceae bacterium]
MNPLRDASKSLSARMSAVGWISEAAFVEVDGRPDSLGQIRLTPEGIKGLKVLGAVIDKADGKPLSGEVLDNFHGLELLVPFLAAGDPLTIPELGILTRAISEVQKAHGAGSP